MIGAIAGDIVGSIYEFDNTHSKDFPLFSVRGHFTDDTVLTIALADAIIRDRDYGDCMRLWYYRYPHESYGGRYRIWAGDSRMGPYNSFGNGSAMRVSPAAYVANDLDTVLATARWSAMPTHNHPEGIKGAQATAAAIFWARTGQSKNAIRQGIENRFGYDLSEPLDSIRDWYQFDVTCQGSVPQAIRAFLEANDFEDTLRNAVSIGGDSDTIACIAGSIAEPFYGVPAAIETRVRGYLSPDLLAAVDDFQAFISKAS